MASNPVLKFESARLKIERANHHINDLSAQFDLFVKRNPYRLVTSENPETGKKTVQLQYRERLPISYALIVGDAVHNLRTALDHMFWEVIGHDGGKQNRHTKFPAYHDRVAFEAACEGIETPSQSVRDTFQALEVFPGGKGDILYSLHLLNNADKHTVLTPVLRIAKASIRVFLPDGRSKHSWVSVIGDRTDMLTLVNVPDGGRFELYDEASATPGIYFNEVFKLKPIIPTLRQLSDAVTDTLDIVAGAIT